MEQKKADTVERVSSTSTDWILKSSKSKPGRNYYFNLKTGESTWTRPSGFIREVPCEPSTSNSKVPSKRKSDIDVNSNQKKIKADEPTNSVQKSAGISSAINPSSEIENQSKKSKADGKKCTSQDCHKVNGADVVAQTACLTVPDYKRKKRIPKKKSKQTQGNQGVDGNKISKKNSIPPELPSTVSQPGATHDASKTSSATACTRNPFTECHSNRNGVVTMVTKSCEPLPLETISTCSREMNAKRDRLIHVKDLSKQKAQARLKRLQASLKKCFKVIPEDSSSSNEPKGPLVIQIKDIDSLPGQQTGPAESRMRKLKLAIQAEQNLNDPDSRLSLQIASNASDHGEEDMEVEYMESEVLVDIEELRQKDLNIDLSTQPVFMDVDMDFSAVESDPKCLIYAVLDTNILLSHLSFTAELLDCNLSGKGPLHLFIPWQVLHELDHLKDKGKSSIQPLARRAINFLHDKFSSKHSRVRGQKMSEATKNASNCADDNILLSCLQLRKQCFDVILVSNDTNLRNKALVSDVQSVSKDELAKQIYKNEKNSNVTYLPFCQSENKIAEIDQSYKIKANETFLTELKTVIKETLSKVVSKGMEDEFKHLWKKRTVIPPPWEYDQALLCLSHHWLTLCDDFIPSIIRDAIQKLRGLFKSLPKGNDMHVSYAEECLELTRAVFRGVSKKYFDVIQVALLKLEELETQMSNGPSLNTNDNFSINNDVDAALTLPGNKNKNDERSHLVFMCFEEAHNAALNICKADYPLDFDHVQKAKCMAEAVEKLVHLLKILLALPSDSLKEDHPAVNELVTLIKGDSSITPGDLLLFLKTDHNRVLVENGITQFTSIKTQLANMLFGCK